MNFKKFCLSFTSYSEALEIVQICKKNKITPILFIKYYQINGLGIDWLNELRSLILQKFKKNDHKIYVDSDRNYGLFISLIEKKIDFIKVKASKDMYMKLKQVAKINKVLINPNFSVVDLSKSKNKVEKLKKLLKKN